MSRSGQLSCEFLERGEPCRHLGTHYIDTDANGNTRVNVAFARNTSGRCEFIESGSSCRHGINHHPNYDGRVFKKQLQTHADPNSVEARLAQLIWRCDFIERGMNCMHGSNHVPEYEKLGLWPFPGFQDTTRKDTIMTDADTGQEV